MSAVNEWIVREYLEALGFLVLQPRKYQVMARAKRAEEEIDLVAWNPHARGKAPAGGMVWGAAELRRVSGALVAVRGWHTDRFSPSLLELSPEVLRFVGEETVQSAEALLGRGPVTKILCVPALAADPKLEAEALEMLRASGVQGVLSFRTILLELAGMIDASKNYEKSDLLQLLRILKNYGLLSGAQMELFGTRRRRRRAGASKPKTPKAPKRKKAESGVPADAPPNTPNTGEA